MFGSAKRVGCVCNFDGSKIWEVQHAEGVKPGMLGEYGLLGLGVSWAYGHGS